MNFCTHCGTPLTVGRFCTNCGAPTGGTATRDGDTAERPAARVPDDRHQTRSPLTGTVPPSATRTDGPRFPLYADEVAGTPPATDTVDETSAPTGHRSERRPSIPLWAPLLVLTLLAVLGVAVWLLTDGDPEPQQASDVPSSSPEKSPAQSDGSSPTEPESPTGTPDDLAPGATVEGPAPLKPSRDLAGKPVTYPAENMLDDDLATAYRMPGDASGQTITFTLPEESVINEVGLVNGYSKTDTAGDRTVDWYALNRKIVKAEWIFDDGTSVVQNLRIGKDPQTVAVDDVATTSIQLRIVEVTPPGKGAMRKDVTAISDVLLRGKAS
jgi:hypothetical protein